MICNVLLTDAFLVGLSAAFSAAYTDVLFFNMVPRENFTLAYDRALTWAQGEKLVAEFVAEARKRTFSAIRYPNELPPTSDSQRFHNVC
jgi:hypothetical protein